MEFVDLAGAAVNEGVTPGNIGTINGHRLKYDTAQADEGVYFIDAATAVETKVTAIQKNKPAQLVFLNPAIPAGPNYHLEVRARIYGGTELRTGRLDATLAS